MLREVLTSRQAFASALGVLVLTSAAMAAGSAEDMLGEAQRLEKAGSDQAAVKAYQAFLEKFPDHSQATEALYRQAKCLDNLGLVEQAIEKLKVVAKVDGKQFRNRADALYLLGKLYASLKDHKAAAETYEKLLAEGAGLNEDEVLNLCAGYYAILGKYDDAAAKFNILKRKPGTALAETASYKLVLLWIKADKLDNAVVAIQELSEAFPKSEHIPEVLLKVADGYRKAGKPDKTVSLCTQIREAYPKTPEALAATYLLGLCQREQKDYKAAVKVFEEVAKTRTPATKLIAADALVQAADLYAGELKEPAKAIALYEDAAALARESEGERRNEILEQCYFHIAEYYYVQKKYPAALEYYLNLRNLGTKINVLGRILACQAELKQSNTAETVTAADVEAIKKKIAENAGTAVAAEAEVFLLDRRLSEAMRNRGSFAGLGAEYEKIAKSYPADVLKKDGLDAYLMTQAGICYGNGTTREDYGKTLAAFEKAIALAPENSANKITCLENIALAAERFGDKERARKTYAELFAISKAAADSKPDDKDAGKKSAEYLKALLTRADTKDAIAQALETAQKVIDEKGALSDLGRAAKFYIAELYFLKKDFSAAAKHYREFISIYGPKQDADGDVVGAPWKPTGSSELVEQLYDASVHIAHCWYLQGHEQNTVKAYAWLVKNFPTNNRYLPEAQYWLALELGKGKAGETRDGKRRMAEALWKNLVNPSLAFEERGFAKGFYPWVGSESETWADTQEYIRTAILKSGQAFSEAGDHETAAAVFAQYLELYVPRNSKRNANDLPDKLGSIARYALGREYIALKSPTGLIKAYTPYISGLRDDPFRVSALKLLGFHAGKAEKWDTAVEAYATLLDEYGTNRTDKNGRFIPVPPSERLRETSKYWDGIRMPPPKDLNLGEIRYALGYQYWKREDWGRCLIALRPFATDADLKANAFRPKALYMAGQSAFKMGDYAAGTPLILALIREHTSFEASEEAHVYAARGLVETKNWGDLELVYRAFGRSWPKSDRRQRMDLYYAIGQVGQGQIAKALPVFRSLAEGETYEDVKADAYYQLGLLTLKSADPKALTTAAGQFEKSVSIYARGPACIEAARAFIKLKQYDKASGYLERIDRGFAKGDPRLVEEAKALANVIEKDKVKGK